MPHTAHVPSLLLPDDSCLGPGRILLLVLLGLPRLLGGGCSVELGLLVGCLEPSMTALGRGVDELQCDFLVRLAAHLRKKSFSEGDDALTLAHSGSLEHDPVLVDHTEVRETSQRSNGFFSQIVLGHSIVLVLLQILTDAVNLLVDLGTMMVTHLTRSGNLPLHSGWVPGTDTSNLSQATVGLAHQPCHSPAGDDTLNSLTLGHTQRVDHLVLCKDISDFHSLLEQIPDEVNLLSSGATIHLNLLDVRLLRPDLHLTDLCVADSTHNSAELFDALQLGRHGLLAVLARVCPSLLVFGVGLL